jgi:hypothetical protein
VALHTCFRKLDSEWLLEVSLLLEYPPRPSGHQEYPLRHEDRPCNTRKHKDQKKAAVIDGRESGGDSEREIQDPSADLHDTLTAWPSAMKHHRTNVVTRLEFSLRDDHSESVHAA